MPDITPESARAHVNPVQERRLKAVATWVNHLARTLKTCRLYDAANPAVVRFREELQAGLDQVLGEHGAFTLRFAPEDVLCEERSLHPARSRDDNLAFVFHRDGVRAITFQPGVHGGELATVVDAVLAVSGPELTDDDLVTLLWEANLPHLAIDYVPGEGDVAAGTVLEEGDEGVPWPGADAAADGEGGGDTNEAPSGGDSDGERAEDWTVSPHVVELEAAFVELEYLSTSECERFRGEYWAERAVPPVTAAIAIAHACMHAQSTPDDLGEMAGFLPRVLRHAIGEGRWLDARAALQLLRQLGDHGWQEGPFAQEMLQPISIGRLVETLDQQERVRVEEFAALARELPEIAPDWLVLLLGESRQKPVRQVIAENLVALVHDHPERLAPWLSDSRWYMVRNIVLVLGWIATPGVVPLMQGALQHPDVRVREEAVNTLAKVDLGHARATLVRALEGADRQFFLRILQVLSGARDGATARYLVGMMGQENFHERPPEERQAIYAAVASVGGDEIVPALEAELNGGQWLQRTHEAHRVSIARCLAHMEAPLARQALMRASQSKRAAVREAADDALAMLRRRQEPAA